jgi:hypothetical protein
MKLVIKKKTTLEDLSAGSLFLYNNSFGFKSEYHRDSGAIEAFCLRSGKMFWGGTSNKEDLAKLVVFEIEIDD